MERILSQPVMRLVAFVTAVITARHLFEEGFHFPTYLLLAHVLSALLLKALLRPQDAANATRNYDRNRVVTFVWLFVYTTSITGALICGYQSLHHVRNTTVWMMVFTLNWDSLFPQDVRSLFEMRAAFKLNGILRYSTFALCVALLFLQDGQSRGKGEWLAVGAIGYLLVAKRVWRLGEERDMMTKSVAGWGAHAIALVASVVPIVAICVPNEGGRSGDFGVYGRVVMLLVNLAAGAVVLCSGVGWCGSDDCDEKGNISETGRLCVAAGLVFLVELDNDLLQPRLTATTLGQWVTYAVALLVTVDFEEFLLKARQSGIPWVARLTGSREGHVALQTETYQSEDDGSLDGQHEESLEPGVTPTRYPWSSLAFQSILNGLVWLLVLKNMLMHRKFDVPYIQDPSESSSLDIVISHYDEPIDEMINAVNSILQTPKIAAMKTTVLIYNKGSEINVVSSKFPFASSVTVSQKENVGREGENVLSHLLNQSYSFADHTLFMQAEPHELHWMLPKIRQYFIRHTGFLSLSYVGAFCADCERCWDVSGYREDVEDVFEQTNPGEVCEGLSLTYRGQFIVSRARMEKVDPGAVRNVRERLLKDNEFGFTLERLWGVVFGCPVIASTCPSLNSGVMGVYAPGGVADCQCLDYS